MFYCNRSISSVSINRMCRNRSECAVIFLFCESRCDWHTVRLTSLVTFFCLVVKKMYACACTLYSYNLQRYHVL